jgi:hypothetical protein
VRSYCNEQKIKDIEELLENDIYGHDITSIYLNWELEEIVQILFMRNFSKKRDIKN